MLSIVKGDRLVAKDGSAAKPKQGQKKGRFKKFLERIAEASQENGGRLCVA
jgi:hypothetical protein